MSPATYLSYEFEPGMTLAQKQEKLYLGVISAGEQAYTLGAALQECRKQLDVLDTLVGRMRLDYDRLKRELRVEAERVAKTPAEPPTEKPPGI